MNGPRVIAHLDTQIGSARHLLGLILRQGEAIRAHEVELVLVRLTEIQTEMGRRTQLEAERGALLAEAGNELGMPGPEVTLEAMCALLEPADGALARERSAELRGLLAEIGREHSVNRALMRQELAFLDHLTRLIGAEPEAGYGTASARPTLHAVDARA